MLKSETTHPWIRFEPINFDRLEKLAWVRLGEAQSICNSLRRVPLPPKTQQSLQRIALIKGVHGTTSIEGNPLTEEQVADLMDGKLELPASQQYQGQEIKNIITAVNKVGNEAVNQEQDTELTVQTLLDYNAMVLKDIELEEGEVAAEIRKHEVGVGINRYKAPLAGECPELVDRNVRWLNEFPISEDPNYRIAETFLKAIYAHLYLAWIHPFGNGNGRTARLLEFQILMTGGVPTTAAHLLSNHYSLTRDLYMKNLARSTETDNGDIHFVSYALEGLVEQLSEQWNFVQTFQITLAWRAFIDDRFAGHPSPTFQRRRQLLLDLTGSKPVSRDQLRTVSPEIAKLYAEKQEKTITRDLNWLLEQELVEQDEAGLITANVDRIFSYLPPSRDISKNP